MEVSVSDLYRIIGEQYITIIALEARVHELEERDNEPQVPEVPVSCS